MNIRNVMAKGMTAVLWLCVWGVALAGNADVAASEGQMHDLQKRKQEVLEKVQHILNDSRVSLRPMQYTAEDVTACKAMLADFVRQRGVKSVAPILITSDYHAPELEAVRNRCPNIYWTEPEKCDPQALAHWLKGYEADSEEALAKANELCNTLFGRYEYALYEVDFDGHKEYAFERSRRSKVYVDELFELLREPDEKELWADHNAAIRQVNTVVNVFVASEGLSANDPAKCNQNKLHDLFLGGVTVPEAYDGLFKYHGKYWSYYLGKQNRSGNTYIFAIGGKAIPACRFDVVREAKGKR